jgi:hypothetical protein
MILCVYVCVVFFVAGLWDKLSYADAVEWVAVERHKGKTPAEIAESLCFEALHRESSDNVTCIVAFIVRFALLCLLPTPNIECVYVYV